MITFLQIVIVLLIIALIAMILGYIFGQFSCKKLAKNHYIEKGHYCETEYAQKHGLNEQIDNLELEMLEEVHKKNRNDSETSKNKDSKELLEIKDKTEEKVNEVKETLINNKKVKDENEDIKDENSSANEELKEQDDKKEKIDNSKENHEKIKINENTNKESDKLDNSEYKDDENSNKQMPKTLEAPLNGKADNLCKIKGIGPVIESKLNDLGIFHFEQIASWGEEEIAWVDSHLSFSGRIIRENWVGQAKLLAKGEDTEFSKRVDKGEVESSRKD